MVNDGDVTFFILIMVGAPFTFGVQWLPVELRWIIWVIWMLFVCVTVFYFCNGLQKPFRLGCQYLKGLYKERK